MTRKHFVADRIQAASMMAEDCTCNDYGCLCETKPFSNGGPVKPSNPVRANPTGIQAMNTETRDVVHKIADTFDTCANACEAAGIGGHPVHGHAAIARRMASHIRSCAAQGQLPSKYDDNAFLHAAAEPAKIDANVATILDYFR
jgi:hypothetical protein